MHCLRGPCLKPYLQWCWRNCPFQYAKRYEIRACLDLDYLTVYSAWLLHFVKYSTVTDIDVADVFDSIKTTNWFLFFASLSSSRCISVLFDLLRLCSFCGSDHSLLFDLSFFWFYALFIFLMVLERWVFSCSLEAGPFIVLFEACYGVLKREWEALESAGDVSLGEVWKKISSGWTLLLDLLVHLYAAELIMYYLRMYFPLVDVCLCLLIDSSIPKFWIGIVEDL